MPKIDYYITWHGKVPEWSSEYIKWFSKLHPEYNIIEKYD